MKRVLVCALAASACASMGDSSRLGLVSLRQYDSGDVQPYDFDVYPGHLRGPSLDVTLSGDCVRGFNFRQPVSLCRVESQRAGFERWVGNSGELEMQLSPDGNDLQVDGQFGGVGGRRPVRMTLPLGSGAQYDEMRRHPVLLALAGSVLGIFGDPPRAGQR